MEFRGIDCCDASGLAVLEDENNDCCDGSGQSILEIEIHNEEIGKGSIQIKRHNKWKRSIDFLNPQPPPSH